jgi:hypothetical protein
MEKNQILGRAMDLLPADWSDGARLAVVAGVAAVCFIVPVLMMVAAFGKKRSGKPAASKLAQAQSTLAVAAADLNPEEWVSGDIVDFDRQKAVGLIRCDRVKGHVRFQAAAFKRAPRVGEKVRFKGRYGGRRKPEAVLVEPLTKSSRAG